MQESFKISAMQRLKAMLSDDSGEVNFRLEFGTDALGFACITGEFSVDLTLLCQRCLNPFAMPLFNEISIGLVSTAEEAEELPGHYEPMLLTDERISLLTLVEDEVLLSVPMAPVHAIEDCPLQDRVKENAGKKVSPFAVLKSLDTKN